MHIIEHGLIAHKEDHIFSYFAWPSITRLDDTLLVGCSGFRIGHLCPFGKVILYRSEDQGQSWASPSVIVDTPLDDRDVGLLALEQGDLLLSFFNLETKYYTDKEWFLSSIVSSDEDSVSTNLNKAMISTYTEEMDEKYAGSFILFSEDKGFTWSNPILVPVTSPHGPCLLNDGYLLYIGKEFRNKETNGPIQAYLVNQKTRVVSYLSDVLLPKELPANCFYEPHAIQLKSGRILLHIRYQDYQRKYGKEVFTIYQSVSDDGGRTWSKPVSLGVNGSPPHLLETSSGAVICVYGRREAPFGQMAIISYDSGDTWSEELTLRADARDSDLGYPCSIQLKDDSIFTVYYQKSHTTDSASIYYTRWKI